MTFVSIFTIAITLFFLGCVVAAFMNIQLWLDVASKQPNAVIYLEDEIVADEQKCDEIVYKISMLSSVDSVLFVDKDEAWKRAKLLYGSQMLEAVDENPLPAAVEITLKPQEGNTPAIDILREEVATFTGIEGIQYSQEYLSVLKWLNKIFKWGIAIIIPILLLALHFMISNTVKLTIYARKDLITNMHYVGATDLYIKTPFILEGMLQGMIGGMIAVIGLYLLKMFLYQFSLYWGDWYFFPTIFSTGVLFGWVGSMRAVRRFLV